MRGPGDLRRWLRFALSGGINTAVDFAVFAGLVIYTGTGVFGANLIAFAAAVSCSFLLNRFWTFRDRQNGSALVFAAWMAAIALLSSWLLARMVGLGLHVAAAKIIVTLMVMVMSYQVMNQLVFHGQRARVAWLGGLAALAGMLGLNFAFPTAG